MAVTTLDPRTALVVIDLQHGIVALPNAAPHSAGEVVGRSVQLADAFRAHDLPVVLVRVTFAADGSDRPLGRTEAPSGASTRRPAGTSSSTNWPAIPRTSPSPSATGAPSMAPTSTSSCAGAASPRSC